MILQRNIPKENLSDMPRVKFPGRIIVIQSQSEALKALKHLNAAPLVGIDTETRPSFAKGQTHKVALMQLSTDTICYLFRLNMIGICDELISFLENPDIIKVGLSLKDDFMALKKRAKFTQNSFIELQDYVDVFGITDKSLQKIFAILFGEKISKSQRLTNWEADVLTDAQKQYAAIDAWACYKIYSKIEELKKTGNYRFEEVAETIK